MKQIKPFHFPKPTKLQHQKYLPFLLKNKKVNQGEGNAFTSENKQTNKQVNEAHKMEKRKFCDVCPFSSRKWHLISDKRNLEQKRNYNQILEVQKYI